VVFIIFPDLTGLKSRQSGKFPNIFEHLAIMADSNARGNIWV